MTIKQDRQYWRAWGAVRKVLRDRGLPPAKADAARKELHRQIGAVYPASHAQAGEPKSHCDLTWRGEGDELTKFFAACAAISEPGNLKPQMKAQQQPEIKGRYVADQLMGEIGKMPHEFDAYLDGVAQRACGKRLIYCHEGEDWRKIIAALTRTAKYKDPARQWPERERAQNQPKPATVAATGIIYMPPSSSEDIAQEAGDAFCEASYTPPAPGGDGEPEQPF